MPIGNPIRKQNESRVVSVLATEGQTVFTVQGGYIINHISVFRNGVRLSNSEDFTAGDGSTVTLNNAANIDDRIEFHIFDRFTVQNAIVGAASTQTISGDVVVNGKIFGNLDVPSINTGIVTTTELDLNGKGDISSDLTIGRHLSVAGVSTFQAVQGTTGTFSGAVSGTTGTFTGDVSIPDTIVHTGDTNTKIRFPDADTITAETAGSERLRITSSGSIGIGTATTSEALHVYHATDNLVARFESGDTGGGITLKDNTHVTSLLTTNGAFVIDVDQGGDISGESIAFKMSGSEKLRISSAGLVGINETSPTDPLHIQNTSSDKGILIKTTGNTYHTICGDADRNNADDNILRIDSKWNGTVVNRIRMLAGPDTTNKDDGVICFDTASGGTMGERLRITSAGLIGIGINNPARILHLHESSSDTCQLHITNSTTGTTGSDGVSFALGSDESLIINQRESNHISLKTADTERLRITSDGKIGINVDTPQKLLDVRGEFAISNSNSSYWDFDRDDSNGSLKIKDTGTERVRINVNGQISIRGTNTAFDTTGDLDSLQIYYETDSGQASFGPYSSGGNTHLSFYTNASGAAATEKVRINSSGSLLVGTTSDAGRLCVQGAAGGVALQTTDATNSTFRISHPSSAVTLLSGGSSQNLALGTGFSEKMRINDSGSLIVGGTSYGAAGTFSVAQNGSFRNVLASGTAQDTLIGAISGSSNSFQMTTDASNNQTYKFHNGSVVTARIDSDGLKFMNDTAAANALDDYEEGNWIPTVTYTNGGGATLSEQLGFYTKVGNQVHAQAAITFSAQGGGSGNVRINGLPFTASGDNGKRINGFMTYATDFNSLNSIPVLYTAGAYTYIGVFHQGQSNGTTTGITNVTRNNCTNNTTIRLYVTYTV